jgi:hypothetical protein
MNDDLAEHVVALVGARLPLLDDDDLDELRDVITRLPGPEFKRCPGCEWCGATTSTHCGGCGRRLNNAATEEPR